MTDRIAELRALLDSGVTPGPWKLLRDTAPDGKPDQYDDWTIYGRDGEPICVEGSNPCIHDPEYIRAVHPVTVAALLDCAEALREVTATLEWQAHGICRSADGPILNSADAVTLGKAAIARLSGDDHD